MKMKRRVPKHQPTMDFPPKDIIVDPPQPCAPPRPPFKDTFVGGGVRPRAPQPTYPDLFWWGY